MKDFEDILKGCQGFEWDEGNLSKSWLKHKVNPFEAEEIFFNQSLVIIEDVKHSREEIRFYALGKTDKSRYLFVCFTTRRDLIRIISSRDMSKKEREVYKTHEEDNPKV